MSYAHDTTGLDPIQQIIKDKGKEKEEIIPCSGEELKK